MIVDLTKQDLMILVSGTSGPPYALFEAPLFSNNGYWIGGFKDTWFWKISERVSEEDLWKMYQVCKDWYHPLVAEFLKTIPKKEPSGYQGSDPGEALKYAVDRYVMGVARKVLSDDEIDFKHDERGG